MTDKLNPKGESVQVVLNKFYDNRATATGAQPIAKMMVESNTHPAISTVAIWNQREDAVEELKAAGEGSTFVIPVKEGRTDPTHGRSFGLGAGPIVQIDSATGHPVNASPPFAGAIPADPPPAALRVIDGGSPQTRHNEELSGLAEKIHIALSGLYKSGIETGKTVEETAVYADAYINHLKRI